MQKMDEYVSLDNLLGGNLRQLFDQRLQQAILNIVDPNVPWKKARTVTLTVTMTPEDDKRRKCATKVDVTCKLPGEESISTTLYVGIVDGAAAAYEDDPQQVAMKFDAPLVAEVEAAR
jgi:hypothetical protein